MDLFLRRRYGIHRPAQRRAGRQIERYGGGGKLPKMLDD